MTPSNITALLALVQADPALAQQLQSATADNAAQLLAKAASQKGLAVDLQAIANYLQTSQTAEITDAELEAVAGGLPGGSKSGTSAYHWHKATADRCIQVYGA